ncbi:MAG: hypothetical protein LBI82_13845 [Dysgonamonadaceae bacterium]|jgi:hypothetical protein|nr:hypothetical protein [Dysgonamonadaceae bacterium]
MKKIISILLILCASTAIWAQQPACNFGDCSGAKRSADMGNAEAMFCYAMFCAQSPEEGLSYIRKSANHPKNYAPAQCYLGNLYATEENGLVSFDPYEAVKWFKKSAEQGFAEAQLYLGNGYMNGLGGLSKNINLAIEWWKKSANQDYFPAALTLSGYYLEQGDNNTALCWFEKANTIADTNRKNVPKEHQAEFDKQFNLAELKSKIKEMKASGYSCSGISRQVEPSKESKATYIRTNISQKTFDSKGGTQDITISSDGKTYNVVSNSPEWCSVETKSGFFTVTCKQNYGAYRSATLTVTADNKTAPPVLIEQTEAVATYIRSNPNPIKINALGGKMDISIITDGYAWSYSDVPSWLTVSKSGKTLSLTAQNNSGNARNGNITISSGNYSSSINILQPQQATYIKAGKSSIRFSTGGNSETVSVETDGEDWTYSNIPSWITAKKDGKYLTLKCSENTGQYSGKRDASLTVKSDNKTAAVYVSQSAPFNAPKGDPRPLGLSVGYVQKQWNWKTAESTTKYGAFDDGKNYVDGIQAGVRFEPLFKYGLGLNTGLFYEYYFAKSGEYAGTDGDYNYTMNFAEHSLYLPLHLEYRANISENFSAFAYVGASFDYGLGAKLTATEPTEKEPFYTETNIYKNSEIGFPNKPLNASFDFGTGIRFDGLQLNIGTSRGLMNISTNPNIRIKQNKPIMVSLSWMIPYDNTNYDKNYNTIPINSIDKSNYRTHGMVFEYISKQWEWVQDNYMGKYGLWEDSKSVPGFRIGYVYQPQFIYGFGLRTGLNLDTYISVSDDWLFSEMAINVPLHAEYRLHLSDKFSIFFEAGPSFDLGLFAEMETSSGGEKYTESDLYGKADWGYPTERFNAYIDLGGGIRFKNLQFNIGTSRGLSEVSVDNGWKVRQNRNLNLGISWMFF